MNLKYKQTEIASFTLFRSNKQEVQRVHYTKGKFDSYDVKCLSGNTYILGEIKSRDYDLAFFVGGNRTQAHPPYLEAIKLINMTSEKLRVLNEKKVHTELYYFNFTNDGFVQVFKLKDLNSYHWVDRYLPIDDNTPEIKKWKSVTELINPVEVFKLNG